MFAKNNNYYLLAMWFILAKRKTISKLYFTQLIILSYELDTSEWKKI